MALDKRLLLTERTAHGPSLWRSATDAPEPREALGSSGCSRPAPLTLPRTFLHAPPATPGAARFPPAARQRHRAFQHPR